MFALNDSKVRKVQAAIMLLICMMAVLFMILCNTMTFDTGGFGGDREQLNFWKAIAYHDYAIDILEDQLEEGSYIQEAIDAFQTRKTGQSAIYALYMSVSALIAISAVLMWKFKLPQIFFLPVLYFISNGIYVFRIGSGEIMFYAACLPMTLLILFAMLAYDVLWIVQWVKKKRARVTTE